MSKSLVLPLITAALLSGCTGNRPVDPSTAQQSPTIESVSKSNGRGIPYGRSDSDALYFRMVLLQQSQDPEYGRKPEKPIHTAPRKANAHIWFLNSLRGPNGQPIEYQRRGSCCAFEDESLEFGGGLLDVYEIKIDGGNETTLLYVDMYRKGPLEIPVGFVQRKEP